MLAQLQPLAFLLITLGIADVVINLAVRLFDRWLNRRVKVGEEPVRRAHVTLDDELSADPFVGDEQCNRCGALQIQGSVRTSCWHCGSELKSAVVEAGPTPPEAA